MSQVYCWECEESYAKDEVFDIPIFNKGYTVVWCLNCAIKQLKWTDYRLIRKPEKYKNFRVRSIEDDGKVYQHFMDELSICFELQFKKLKKVDENWREVHYIANEVTNEEEM